MLTYYHVEPGPEGARLYLRFVEGAEPSPADQRFAVGALRVFTRLEPGHELLEREVEAAREALRRLGWGW